MVTVGEAPGRDRLEGHGVGAGGNEGNVERPDGAVVADDRGRR